MNKKGITVSFLLIFSSLLPCSAEPVRAQDISSNSSWAAHLNFAKLDDPPLNEFLLQVAGFNQVLQLQNILKEELAIDWKSIEGVTLFGAGDDLQETAMIMRGNMDNIDLSKLPPTKTLPNHPGIKLRLGPEWQKSSLVLAKVSNRVWTGGTNLEATNESLNLLAGLSKSKSSAPLPKHAVKELESAAAMLSIDMKKLNDELKFEADFTRAIRQGWFLVGTRDDLMEATLMIDSTDAEGLLYLQKQLQLLSVLLASNPESPAIWLELTQSMKVEFKENWMTLKIAASPEKAALFLKTLGPLFVESPVSADQGD